MLHRPAQSFSEVMQVHCVKAAPQLLALARDEGPFPSGLVLHSFLGPADFIKPFCAIEGSYFSMSGHCLRSAKKAPDLISQVWPLGSVQAQIGLGCGT